MQLSVWNKCTDFAILITISVNARYEVRSRHAVAYLTKYTYHEYILHILYHFLNIYVCLKFTRFLRINAGNSLSGCNLISHASFCNI